MKVKNINRKIKNKIQLKICNLFLMFLIKKKILIYIYFSKDNKNINKIARNKIIIEFDNNKMTKIKNKNN
jgi:hypothetical protein